MLIPGDEDDELPMYANMYQCTYTGNTSGDDQSIYAIYSDMNYTCPQSGIVFTRCIEVYHGSILMFTVDGNDHGRGPPYFFNHRNQCYFVVTDRCSIIFRDMTGAIVSRCSTKYGCNALMTINHVNDYFILEVYCHGYGSTPEVGREGNIVRGVVSVDQALDGGAIILTRNHFDPGRKCFRTGTCDNYGYLPLSDDTVASFESDIANLDYVTMWQQICDNMWRKNIKSPLRLLLSNQSFDMIDVTVDLSLAQRLLAASSIKIRPDEHPSWYSRDAYYDRHIYWLMLDTDDLTSRLKQVMFISGDQNPASGHPEDICLCNNEMSRDDYLIYFDDTTVKLSLQCQLTLYDGTDYPDETYYVYDSRVCRIRVAFIKFHTHLKHIYSILHLVYIPMSSIVCF